MSAQELADWQLYYEEEPFGPHYEASSVATVAVTIYNLVAGAFKMQPLKTEDFIPKYQKPLTEVEKVKRQWQFIKALETDPSVKVIRRDKEETLQ